MWSFLTSRRSSLGPGWSPTCLASDLCPPAWRPPPSCPPGASTPSSCTPTRRFWPGRYKRIWQRPTVSCCAGFLSTSEADAASSLKSVCACVAFHCLFTKQKLNYSVCMETSWVRLSRVSQNFIFGVL